MSEIRGLCLDVDGVLTDGRLYIDDEGRTTRAFHTQDGLAIRAFQRLGGRVVICTGKRSGSVAARARELEIAHVIQGSTDKLVDVRAWLDQQGLRFDELAAVGDDLPDLPVLRHCGLPIAVANAVDEVKTAAHYVTGRVGGDGAVREAIEYVLRASGRWSEVLAFYAGSQPESP